jgi:hypothetical protein
MLAKCAHAPKFGHIVKTSQSEALWTTVFALGISHLPCSLDLIGVKVYRRGGS